MFVDRHVVGTRCRAREERMCRQRKQKKTASKSGWRGGASGERQRAGEAKKGKDAGSVAASGRTVIKGRKGRDPYLTGLVVRGLARLASGRKLLLALFPFYVDTNNVDFVALSHTLLRLF